MRDGTNATRGSHRFGSLRVRLTLAVALLSGLGLTLAAVLLVRAVEGTVLRAIEDASQVELEGVRVKIESGVPADSLHFAPPPGRFIRFLRDGGPERGVAIVGPGPFEMPFPPPDWAVTKMKMVSPAEGPITAAMMTSLEDVRRSTSSLVHVLLVGVPVLVLLLTAAAWVLIGRALRPVRSMTERAATIADASTTDRLEVAESRDEIGTLGVALNGMLDRLAQGARRQREFVSDASHELRSPVAAIRALLEVAIAHPEVLKQQAILRGALDETGRLEGLVADLLALARLDERPAALDEEVDIDDVVLEEAARSASPGVDAQGVRPAKVRGDRRAIAHLTRNLLDNASRHARSSVSVSTSEVDGEVVIRVDDDGPGIPAVDRDRVFERFTRLASSRSRDTGGAGLGLSLVRRIAVQHGGSVVASAAPSGGARIEVRLPALDTNDRDVGAASVLAFDPERRRAEADANGG